MGTVIIIATNLMETNFVPLVKATYDLLHLPHLSEGGIVLWARIWP